MIKLFMFQKSSFKNNQDQDLRPKIQELREDSIKINIKNVFQNIDLFIFQKLKTDNHFR